MATKRKTSKTNKAVASGATPKAALTGSPAANKSPGAAGSAKVSAALAPAVKPAKKRTTAKVVAEPKELKAPKAAKTTKAPKAAKAAKAAKAKATDSPFPARVLPPLPPELRGNLPKGTSFEALPMKAPFRYHEAVARGFNELWERVGERSYGPIGSDRDFVFPQPTGVLVLLA